MTTPLTTNFRISEATHKLNNSSRKASSHPYDWPWKFSGLSLSEDEILVHNRKYDRARGKTKENDWRTLWLTQRSFMWKSPGFSRQDNSKLWSPARTIQMFDLPRSQGALLDLLLSMTYRQRRVHSSPYRLRSKFITLFHGSSPFITVHHRSSRFITVHHRSSRSITVLHSPSRTITAVAHAQGPTWNPRQVANVESCNEQCMSHANSAQVFQ